MLQPIENDVRERKSLCGLSRFAVDPGGMGRHYHWWQGTLPAAREIAVPASYNDLFADAAIRDHVGDAWYQTDVRVPRGWAGQRMVLRFDAATHRATVWLDDTEVMTHDGGNALTLRPDMASLSTGSVNFPTIVYENSASLMFDLATRTKSNDIAPEIEIYDLSHIHKRLIDSGLMSPSPHVQFVLSVKNAMPADEHLLGILLAETRRVIPVATWTAAGIGSNQTSVMSWALLRGADALRTGLDDNISVTKDRLANGNAELVAMAVNLVSRHGCRPASPAEARHVLKLRPLYAVAQRER